MTDPHEGAGDHGRTDDIDWIAAERSPEFKKLVSTRNRFVVPLTVFFMTWYLGFILLAGAAKDFMGREFLFDGLTVGYMLALSQFVMVWVLSWWYIKRADREFDPLARAAAKKAVDAGKERRASEEGPAR